jgi:uncharacterized protein YcfJ
MQAAQTVNMKHTLLCVALGLASAGAGAQEVGRVLSSTPVVQQVAVPQQVCGQPVVVEQQTSGGGGLLGAVVGAAIGSQIGGGSGRAAGLMAGAVGGALLGNSIEANNRQAHAMPQCTTQTSYENRTVGYNVVYEYAGREHTVQLPYDPGSTIALQVTPVGASHPVPPVAPVPHAGLPGGPVVVAPAMQPNVTVHAPAPVVYSGYPAYPAYAAYPPPVYRAYPPVQFHIGIGGHFHRHRHHRH